MFQDVWKRYLLGPWTSTTLEQQQDVWLLLVNDGLTEFLSQLLAMVYDDGTRTCNHLPVNQMLYRYNTDVSTCEIGLDDVLQVSKNCNCTPKILVVLWVKWNKALPLLMWLYLFFKSLTGYLIKWGSKTPSSYVAGFTNINWHRIK